MHKVMRPKSKPKQTVSNMSCVSLDVWGSDWFFYSSHAFFFFLGEHTTIPRWIDPVCFFWDQFLEQPMSGGVPGHQLLVGAEKVAKSRPELPCCVSIMLLASRYATPHFSSVKLLSVLRGSLIRLCPDLRSVCNYDYLWTPCEYGATRCQCHSRRGGGGGVGGCFLFHSFFKYSH